MPREQGAVQLCQGEGVTEYFRELVEEAVGHQQLHVDAMTSYYVVQVLVAFSRSDLPVAETALSDEPLAVKLGEALEAGGSKQRQMLRCIGDASLFISGFFPDRLRRSLVGVDYYAALGGYAYGALSHRGDDLFAPVFRELADHFLEMVDVLEEVSERSSLNGPHDLLRLYERWLQTGSSWSAERLVAQGVIPVAGSPSRVQ
jgi:hypothetical protein